MSRQPKPIPPLHYLAVYFRINSTQDGLIRFKDNVSLRGKRTVLFENVAYSQASIIFALHNGYVADKIAYIDNDSDNMHVDNLADYDKHNQKQDEFVEGLIS